jgi:two-component system, NtrC family, sensor kinase
MKILVADDSEPERRLLAGLLRKWEYDSQLASDGAEAWRLFQAQPYPLVLTDWIMPEMSGIELIQRIRKLDLPFYVYIVILTGRNEKEDLIEAMDAGADDFVAKPVHPGELRARVRHGERIVRLERRLADQNRQLRETQAALVQSEKLASLGQLAAGMSHEINNPIAFVANNLAVLKRDVAAAMSVLDAYREVQSELAGSAPQLTARAVEKEAECDLDWIRGNVELLFDRSQTGLARVRQIVSNLRDFARLDEAEFDELDVNAALRSTVNLLHHELEAKRLVLKTDFAAVNPVLCHPGKINQVFHSVLLNAIQASHSTGVIELRTISDDKGVTVEVEDHGCGIDRGNLPRIFEPFFTTKPVGSGAGLALAACYGIVRDHGGTIGVESEAGRGSLFRVRLPYQPALADRQRTMA